MSHGPDARLEAQKRGVSGVVLGAALEQTDAQDIRERAQARVGVGPGKVNRRKEGG